MGTIRSRGRLLSPRCTTLRDGPEGRTTPSVLAEAAAFEQQFGIADLAAEHLHLLPQPFVLLAQADVSAGDARRSWRTGAVRRGARPPGRTAVGPASRAESTCSSLLAPAAAAAGALRHRFGGGDGAFQALDPHLAAGQGGSFAALASSLFLLLIAVELAFFRG